MTLDGVMQAPGGPEEDPTGGFTRGGWSAGDVPDEPGAEQLNSARKYVASRTLDKVEWNNLTLLEGDVGEAVASIKQEKGPEIQVHGSSELIQTLLSASSSTSSGS